MSLMVTSSVRARGNGLLKVVRLASLAEALRASLWVVPAGCILAAGVLALVLPWLDHRIGRTESAWYLYAGQPESARELLSTIASAMVSLAGLVFSITILVLQLASSQFSPRVLRTFMSDRTTQAAMGTFLGSFVYTLLVLPQVLGTNAQNGFVPALAVFIAFAFAVASVLMFVRYIHHMASSIRPVHVMRVVAERGHQAMLALYPKTGGDPLLRSQEQPPERTPDLCVEIERCGVITGLAEEDLMRLACQHDLVIRFTRQVGEFVPGRAPLFLVWGARALTPDTLLECVVVEHERSPRQDLGFALRQLVDIAERALSPGINDPTTAVQALDYIHDLLRALACREIPGPERIDEHGALRLVLPCPDWPAYVHLGLDEIRHYGGRSLQVVRRMRSVLDDLLMLVGPPRAPVLREQLRLLDMAIERNFEDTQERAFARTAHGTGPMDKRSPA